MNETLKAISERYSCKNFSDTPVEADKLDAIANAALASPSATNKQPWQITVVTDKALITELQDETVKVLSTIPPMAEYYNMIVSTGMKLLGGASSMIVLPIDKANEFAQYDCGIAAQTICIAAQSLGVSSHIVAIPDMAFGGEKGSYFTEKFSFPEGYGFGLAVLLGYEAAPGKPHDTVPEKIVYIK